MYVYVGEKVCVWMSERVGVPVQVPVKMQVRVCVSVCVCVCFQMADNSAKVAIFLDCDSLRILDET